MLNMSLTVSPHKANSHHGRWMPFIDKVIKALITFDKNIIYLLWGKEAQQLNKYIGSNGRVLESSHPSPLGARYGFNRMDHFNQTNEILRELNREPIDWQIPP
jgi:uracil-DNA glycosylase